MSLIKRAAHNASELRYTAMNTGDPYAIPSNGSLANYSGAGVAVDAKSAMGLASVWTCVRILSTTIGSFELNTFNKVGNQLVPTENVSLARNPFGTDSGVPMSRQIGLEQMMVSLLLRGNSYNYVLATDEHGYPTQILPLNPDVVQVDREPVGGAKRFRVGGHIIPSELIIHIPGMSMPGDLVGMSPVSYLAQTLGLGIASDEYSARFYSNGANMSGLIEVASDLDSDAARQLKERFTSRNTGLKNAHNIGLLTGGATFKPLGIKQTDMQFLETKSFNSASVASIYGCPPHLMGNVADVSTSWGMSPEQQNQTFLTYTLKPWLTRFEEAFSNALPVGQMVRFDTDSLLRTDAKGRAAIYASSRMAGWQTVNEIRTIEGLPPVEGGDQLDTPLNSAHNGKNDGTDNPPPDNGANA